LGVLELSISKGKEEGTKKKVEGIKRKTVNL